jgi:dTDP-4-amino-4,6-dideoxygalactose transaminase
LFVVQSTRRDLLQQKLRTAGISTQVHYPCPPHLQGAYASLGLGAGAFPRAEQLAREVLSLPLGWDFDIAAAARTIGQIAAD